MNFVVSVKNINKGLSKTDIPSEYIDQDDTDNSCFLWGNPKYELGYRYCTTCSYSILGDMLLCPCCKTILRRKPRHKSISSLISQKGELAYVWKICQYSC